MLEVKGPIQNISTSKLHDTQIFMAEYNDALKPEKDNTYATSRYNNM